MCGYITWKSIKVAEYIYHCVTISPGKLSKLRSICIIEWLYHLENNQSCGVYILSVAILCEKVSKLRSIFIIVWLYHVEKYSSCGVYISLCGYITWKSIKVAGYIYYCVVISRGKVLKLRSIYIIVWLYHVETY